MSYLKAYNTIGAGLDMSDLSNGSMFLSTDPDESGTLISDEYYDADTNVATFSKGSGASLFYFAIYYGQDRDGSVTIRDLYYFDRDLANLLKWEDCDIFISGDDLAAGTTDWFFDGFQGPDEIIGNRYSDTLKGGDSADILRGRAGDDVLNGERGDDRLHGQTGDDLLYGKSGADRLSGNEGDDELSGAAGRDSLTGGTGSDLMSGGTGADSFIFKSIGESAFGRSRDIITDFETGRDEIVLTSIDADTTRRGNQSFDFIGGASYSDTPGELRYKNGILSGDVDGDGRSDFQIELSDISSLHSSDLLL